MSKQESLIPVEEYKKNFVRNKKGRSEESLQIQIGDYLRNKYPDVIWFCDLASGMKLPIWIAAKFAKMRSSRALPDLFITKPMMDPYIDKLGYNGLFIELKKEGTRLKNGNMPKSDHHDEQAAILARLRTLGYKAEFSCGYDETVKLIDDYLGGR